MLDEIDEEVRRGKGRGRLNELWALIGAVNAARERGRRGAGVGGIDGTEWAVVDDEGLAQIAQVCAFLDRFNWSVDQEGQILSTQQAGLAHLTKILQGNLKDLDVVLGSTEPDDDSERLYGSTSTLRASALQ
jgi:nuclear pore complex protein Nup54